MLYLRVKIFNIREQCQTIWRHYGNVRFALVDLALGFCSLFFNPYRVCRKLNGQVYGETPLSTFRVLAEAANLKAEDRYVELGSGRGKTCFWAALCVGCSVRGIEWVPLFAGLSRLLASLFRVPVQFEQRSIFESDLSGATVIYFYDFQQLPPLPVGVRLITISEPHPEYKIVKEVPVVFPWGKTTAYIQTA